MVRKEKKIIIIYTSWGPLFEKVHKGKEEEKIERTRESFIRI